MDDSAEITRIENNGNKPEEWLDFLRKAKRRSKNYEYIVGLYEKAASSISPDDTNRKNICYARLLVEFAKLQGMSSAEDARETFRCARCNVKRFAIVYIAWAQFELDKGNREKCRNHLLKGKTNRAEPSDILQLALKSCEQGNDRLLDDETEEWIFTGVVTKTKPRPSICLPTVMSDNEMTTEKLLGDDNTADNTSQSKSDTGVISFKLPQSIDDKECKQRQKLSSSGSSSEDTMTAPFHHIVKPNRSMSTVKALKATPDCRTVASKSISNSLNLSVRKPSCRTGIGKSFGVLMGPPLRARPVTLEEEKESELDDMMEGIKPIDHNLTSNPINENPSNKQHTNNENFTMGSSLIGQQPLAPKNSTTTNDLEHLPLNQDMQKNTNLNQIRKAAFDNTLGDIISNPKLNTDSSTFNPTKATLPTSLNSEQYSTNTEQDSNNIVIEKQPKIKQFAGTHEKDWLSKSDKNISSLQVTNKPESGLSFQGVAKPKPHEYTSGSAATVSSLFETVKPVQQDFSDGHFSNSLTNGILPNSSLASCQNQSHELAAVENPHCATLPSNPINQNIDPQPPLPGHPVLSNIHSNPMIQNINSEPPSVKRTLCPNNVASNSVKTDIGQGVPSRSMNINTRPSSLSNKSRNISAQARVPMGMDSYAGLNEKNILYMQSKNIPGYPNQHYPPPQDGAGYPNIVVNGKSYLKLGTIGRGGSSKVFRAFDGKRICAIKYVSLEDADDFIVQSYINEIDMLKRLQGSDHIIKLYDWEQKKDENSIILVLECGSIDLAAFLRKNRSTFTETELIPYWKQMLEAVNVIHNQGIIHSDLKPANFLFVEGRLKLIDFGIANSIQADQTSIQRDTQVGTLNFMSPEAFQDISGQSAHMNTGRSRPCTKIGRPSDVWSLGCILYAMVYGRTPFQHITNQAMKLQCIIDENYVIEFPPINNPKLLDVLKGCLIRNPRERYTIPQLLEHQFLCKPDDAKEPDEEMFFDALVELNGANFSPSSFRVATKNIFDQLRSGNKIDVSSIVAKRNHQALHGNSLPGRQPLSGLTIDAVHVQGHGAMKSSTPYMTNNRPYLDKENAADVIFNG